MRTPDAVAGMLCPVCKVGLAMSDRQGIEIDYCPQCRGIWLDRGELDKIIERSAETAPAPAPSPETARPAQQPYPSQTVYPPQQQSPWQGGGYRDDDDHRRHGGHKHKRRKSFLEELFD